MDTRKYYLTGTERVAPPKFKAVEETAEELKVTNQIVEDMELGRENLRKENGNFFFQRRGISQEAAMRYGYGFIDNWVHPKLQVVSGDKKIVPSDIMIIPTGDESYVTRAG